MTLGQRLQKAREKSGKTQSAIATEVGVRQPTVHAWENDECRPGVDRAVKVSRAYGIGLKHLLDPKTVALLKAAGA